jgi:hypothetical protein
MNQTSAQGYETITEKLNFILTAEKLSISCNSIRDYRQALSSLYFTDSVELKIPNCTRNLALSLFEPGTLSY